MGWERRERGGLYYTRSRRVRGRVVREYVGGGEDAALIARMESLERQHRQAIREAEHARAKRLDEAEAALNALCAATDELVTATLFAAGYHRHDRGGWRRRRGRD